MRPARFNIIRALVPEADLLVDYMTVRPQGNRAFLVSDTIRRIKAARVWDKLDLLYVMAAADSQAAGLNWKSPGTFALSVSGGTPTFTADRGYTGNGASSLTTGWDAATNKISYAQDSAHIGGRSRTSATTATGWMGGVGTNRINLCSRHSTGNATGRLNSGTNMFANASADGSGLWVYNRSVSTTVVMYRNGAAFGVAETATSAALDTSDIGLLRDNGGQTVVELASAFLGGSLSAGEITALYDAELAYMTAVGAA